MTLVERVAEGLLNEYRRRQGIGPTTLAGMRPEHRVQWLQDARAAIAAVATVTVDEAVPGGLAIEDAMFGEGKLVFHAAQDAVVAICRAAIGDA
jgi:hypothetical protein